MYSGHKRTLSITSALVNVTHCKQDQLQEETNLLFGIAKEKIGLRTVTLPGFRKYVYLLVMIIKQFKII